MNTKSINRNVPQHAATKTPQARTAPVPLTPEMLRQVSGGAPKGTWQEMASVKAPKGTW